MSHCKHVFIVGHPGAGKALVAKMLAEKLGWQFIDADFGLEFRVGRTLTDIMGNEGEKSFQECASEILTFCLNKENIVVTTDVSIACNEKNRKLLSSEFVVYLKVSTQVQLDRTTPRNPVPLLNTSIKDFLDKLHQERDIAFDEISSLSIDTDDNALEEHVSKILKSLDTQATKITDEKDLILFHKNLHIPVNLSGQQGACLKLLAQGKTSKEIARDMGISYRTVEGYIAKTMEQLGCSSSKELIALYYDKP